MDGPISRRTLQLFAEICCNSSAESFPAFGIWRSMTNLGTRVPPVLSQRVFPKAQSPFPRLMRGRGMVVSEPGASYGIGICESMFGVIPKQLVGDLAFFEAFFEFLGAGRGEEVVVFGK